VSSPLKGVLGLPYVPEVLFYELLDSVRGYLLQGLSSLTELCFFTVCITHSGNPRFYLPHGGYRVRRELRETVLFAAHDLLKGRAVLAHGHDLLPEPASISTAR
jgi:hypothetical protein